MVKIKLNWNESIVIYSSRDKVEIFCDSCEELHTKKIQNKNEVE